MKESSEVVLNLIETFRATEEGLGASSIFRGEGTPIRRARAMREAKDPGGYRTNLKLVADLFEEAQRTRWGLMKFEEAMGVGDLSDFFFDILDRAVLANYNETPSVYDRFVNISKVKDFRPVKRFAVNGMEGQLDLVPPQTEYSEAQISDVVYGYSVNKYGKRAGFAWEDVINDDLGILGGLPDRLARGARRTERRFAAGLYVDHLGPNAALYNGGNKNLLTIANGAQRNNPPLDADALKDAVGLLKSQVDADGEPIEVGRMTLVVSQNNAVQAAQILQAVQLRMNVPGAGGTQEVLTNNPFPQYFGTEAVEDVYILSIAKDRAAGANPWFLFADPREGRPALEMGFLRGMEAPSLFVKSPNAERLGGGIANPMDGDFDTDSMQYKIRHVLGGTRMDPKMTIASRGDGLA